MTKNRISRNNFNYYNCDFFLKTILVVLFIVLCDQLTKIAVIKFLVSRENHLYSITDFLNLTLVYNLGISFGFLGKYKLDPHFFVFMSFIVILILLFYYHKRRSHYGRSGFIFIGLIIGGAIGNIIDRFIFGAVIDFLDFHLIGYHYPAFNIADSAVVLGAFYMLFQDFFCTKR